MRLKCVIIGLIASLAMLGGCAGETCPVAMKADYHLKKKVKFKHKSKRKPTPSLIHITRVNYKPSRGY